MKHRTLSAACLLGLTAIGTAAEPPRQSFECDTPSGHFSYWNRTVAGLPIDVEGTLTVNELRPDGKWSPTALLILEGANSKQRYGLRLYTIPKIPDSFFLDFVKSEGNEKLGLGLVPSTKEPIPFALHLDAEGKLQVSFAGFEATAALGGFKPTKIELGCSTGDFEFKDFTIKGGD